MQTLYVKLTRELWQMRWQALAIASVTACGVATAVMSLSTLDSLERTRSAYFERHRFADVFAQVKRAPEPLVQQIADVPGVAAVDARIVVGVTLDVDGLAEPATGRLISLPESGPMRLNTLYLRRGRMPEPGRGGEVIAAEAFAEAHGLSPGDQIRAIINGRLQELLIVGIGLSPEYIYSVRPGELLPDDKRFGVLWMGYVELAAAFDLDGAFNDVSLLLEPGASEAEAIQRLDDLLDPYGGTGAYGRADQPSYRFLDNEMVQLRTMASLPPAIFLSVTAFLLNVVLSRQIGTQREQIATMRAFGYSRGQIARHYLGFAVAISAVGTVGGILLGSRLGYELTVLYAQFFRFPEFYYTLDPRIALLAAGVSVAAAVLAVLSAVRRAVRESPAQAMQPEPPASYRPSLVERLGLAPILSPAAQMVVRHLERQPVRAMMSGVGVALAVGILILGNFGEDAINFLMEFQFERVQRQDVMVTFVEPAPRRILNDLNHLPGVLAAEPFRAVAARIRSGPASRRLAVMGLPGEGRLFRALDAQGETIALPPEGVVISAQLAEVLHCRVGDWVWLEVLEGHRPTLQVYVARIIDDFLELNVYMRLDALNRLMREQDAVSGAFLAVDSLLADPLYAELKQTPQIAGVAIKRFAIESYRRTMAENMLQMKAINVAFASVVAFGVVFNSARVMLSERSRELATLRVLGFTRQETARILFGELGIIVAFSIPLGWICGYLLAAFLTISLATEVHRFPLIVSRQTYAFATIVVLVATIVSLISVRRRLNQLDLVAVLKSRD